MERDQYQTLLTAELEAGLTGLWKLAKKMTSLALGWKLLEILQCNGMATPEVEHQAQERMIQRNLKKGILPEESKKNCKRDERHVKEQMKIRIRETKEDWCEARDRYKEERNRVTSLCRNELERNRMKKEYRKLDQDVSRQFQEGTERHKTSKLQHYKGKYSNLGMTNQTDANDWFTMIAIGNQTPKEPKKVPNYGGVSLDEDETAAMSLPTKFATLSKITMNNVQYENLLCNTKTRWNRMTKGSPKEQLEAIEEDPESENPSDEQQILENLTREIYNPETKTQDLTKLKATDMKHNPRLHLPPPRPPQEEVAFANYRTVHSRIIMA